MDKDMEKCITRILIVLLSPIAFLGLIFMVLFYFLQFFFKATLLFIIVAIYTPIAVMCHVSILMLFYKTSYCRKSNATYLRWFDPRARVGIEVQLLVSDFFKVIAGEFLLILSTGVITFYTAPRRVFYISMTVGVIAILLKWLNSNSLSKTAFSCLCDGYGLNPMMFLFSFMGLFDIGCHPIAKCSFAAETAFLFTKIDTEDTKGNKSKRFDSTKFGYTNIEFLEWSTFARVLFQMNPRIDFIEEGNGRKYILKSFMVLKLFGVKLCEYPVQRLELPEDYSDVKANELYNFLVIFSKENGFVTDKMRGRYEHSLTLLEIVDGVKNNDGYKVVNAKEERLFLVVE